MPHALRITEHTETPIVVAAGDTEILVSRSMLTTAIKVLGRDSVAQVASRGGACVDLARLGDSLVLQVSCDGEVTETTSMSGCLVSTEGVSEAAAPGLMQIFTHIGQQALAVPARQLRRAAVPSLRRSELDRLVGGLKGAFAGPVRQAKAVSILPECIDVYFRQNKAVVAHVAQHVASAAQVRGVLAGMLAAHNALNDSKTLIFADTLTPLPTTPGARESIAKLRRLLRERRDHTHVLSTNMVRGWEYVPICTMEGEAGVLAREIVGTVCGDNGYACRCGPAVVGFSNTGAMWFAGAHVEPTAADESELIRPQPTLRAALRQLVALQYSSAWLRSKEPSAAVGQWQSRYSREFPASDGIILAATGKSAHLAAYVGAECD